MTVATRVPGIPRPPASVDPETRQYLEALAEAVEIRLGRRGDPRDRAVTLRELIDSGLAKDLKARPFDPNNWGSSNIGFTDASGLSNPATPPAIIGLSVAGAYSEIILSWNASYYGNHSQVEIWSHPSDTLGDATLAGITTGFTYSDPVGGGVTRYYWVRNVSTAGVYGPFNSGSGTAGTTTTDVAHQLEVLGNAITSSQLASSLATPIALIPSIQTTANAAATSAQLSTEATTRANADTALSSTVSTLSSTVGGHTTSIQTNATSVNGLSGQYSVKIDSNGHVAGFGLSSTTTTAGPTSAFIVRADKFAVINPASTADGLGTTTPTAANIPFFISGGTTYIKAAAILDASITNAKIGALAADKITTGTLSANRIAASSLNVSKLDLVGTGSTINLQSAASGARMQIQGDVIRIYDGNGTIRVKLGNLN
jgi:hypothetical protein